MAGDPTDDPRESPPGPRFHPLVVVLGCQLIGASTAFGGAAASGGTSDLVLPLWVVLAVQGLMAALLGLKLGLARMWFWPQMLAPPLLGLSLLLPIRPWVYLVGFALLLGVYWNAIVERVPLYLTNRTTWRALARLIEDRPKPTFADLGSGLGGTVGHLGAERPDGHFVGIESAPLPFVFSWLRLRFPAWPNVDLVFGSFWNYDLGPFDVVYCFLSPAPMARLMAKARREMKPGSILISNSFEVPGVPPDDVITLDDGRKTRLLIWRV